MSKRLVFATAILISLLLMVACGGDTTPAPEAAPAQEDAAASEPAPAEEEAAPAQEEAPAEEAAPTEEAMEEEAEVEEGASEGVSLSEEEPDATEEETEAEPAEEPAAAEQETESAPAEEAPAEGTASEHAADLSSMPAAGGSLTGQEAYELARAQALEWQSDAVLIEMGASLLGPLDEEGKSESWSLSWWAPGTNELNTMLYLNGSFTGTPIANTGFPKAVPDIESVIFDTKRLYDIAAAAGGSDYIAQGYNLMPGLTTYPVDETIPAWYFNYSDPNDNTVAFTVIIDARSGDVINAVGHE